MKKTYLIPLTVALIFSLTFCCSKQGVKLEESKTPQKKMTSKKTTPKTTKYENAAFKKFNKNYTTIYNKTKDYILCLNSRYNLEKMNTSSLAFFIYDLNKEEIILDETISYGSVEWIDNYKIKVEVVPGIVKGNDEESNSQDYVYNVKEGKKEGKTMLLE